MGKSVSKEQLLEVRKEFFDRLTEEWSRPPEYIDELMGQDTSFLPIDNIDHPGSVVLNEPERGFLVRSITLRNMPKGRHFRLLYSIFQAGDWIRYGVIFQGDVRSLMRFEASQAALLEDRIWDCPPELFTRENSGVLLEWRFIEPDFYENYVIRDRFYQISRHMHFRMCQAIQVFYIPPDVAGDEFD